MRCAVVAALIFFAVACGGEPEPPSASSGLPAEAISLGVELRSNGGLAQIVVRVFREFGAVILSGEDQLLFSQASGPPQPLTRFESERPNAREGETEDELRNRSQISYVGQLATGATEFELVLSRKGGVRVISTLTLPAPFALSVPAAPVSRAQLIPITWDADSGPSQTRLEIGAPCLRQGIWRSFEFDPGAYQVQPADIFLTEGSMDCDFQTTVTRSGGDAAFAPELAPTQAPPQIEQVRVAVFTTVP
jgi:hypothetical protein